MQHSREFRDGGLEICGEEPPTESEGAHSTSKIAAPRDVSGGPEVFLNTMLGV